MQVFGSRRWIPLPGGFKFQVSEFVKIVLVLLVARYLSELNKDELDWRSMLKLGGLIGMPMVLVMKQPDLGTSLTYLPILIVGVFLAGVRWKYVAVAAGSARDHTSGGWFFLKDYQRARLTPSSIRAGTRRAADTR